MLLFPQKNYLGLMFFATSLPLLRMHGLATRVHKMAQAMVEPEGPKSKKLRIA
jgi:hypothetical protein